MLVLEPMVTTAPAPLIAITLNQSWLDLAQKVGTARPDIGRTDFDAWCQLVISRARYTADAARQRGAELGDQEEISLELQGEHGHPS